MALSPASIPAERIAAFCLKHAISRLSLFGSALHDQFRPDSDIDILVEFPAGRTPSLLDLGGMLMELRDIFGRDVDLKTPAFLSPRLRVRVSREAQALYAA